VPIAEPAIVEGEEEVEQVGVLGRHAGGDGGDIDEGAEVDALLIAARELVVDGGDDADEEAVADDGIDGAAASRRIEVGIETFEDAQGQFAQLWDAGEVEVWRDVDVEGE